MKLIVSILACAVAIGHVLGSPVKNANSSQSAHGTLTFAYSPNITRVTFNNPPINLYTPDLCSDLLDFMTTLEPTNQTSSAPGPKVVIFDSANPDFFLDHFDLTQALLPFSPLALETFRKNSDVVHLLRNITTTVFISEINGLATGIGNEFLTQTDMRFAGPNARAGQIEVPFGATPNSGGVQALPRLIGRGRAMQYLLTGESVDGPTGAAIGWFNEYFASADALRRRVSAVANMIALYPVGGIAATKAGLQSVQPPEEAYDADQQAFNTLVALPNTQDLLKKGIALGANQTRSAFELGLDATVLELYQ